MQCRSYIGFVVLVFCTAATFCFYEAAFNSIPINDFKWKKHFHWINNYTPIASDENQIVNVNATINDGNDNSTEKDELIGGVLETGDGDGEAIKNEIQTDAKNETCNVCHAVRRRKTWYGKAASSRRGLLGPRKTDRPTCYELFW